jgi:hypothetical protein
MTLELRIPPEMGQKQTLGMCTSNCGINCLWVLGDLLGGWVICVAAGIGSGKGRCVGGLHVISGMLPGMLFLVQCKCICLVNLRVCLAVESGTIIIGGASVICRSSGASAWVTGVTLCSTLCSGSATMGTLCRLS